MRAPLFVKDMSFAKAKTALVAVTMIALSALVVFLSGLTGGLSERNIEYLSVLPGNHATLKGTQNVSLESSTLTRENIDAIADGYPALSVELSRGVIRDHSASMVSLTPLGEEAMDGIDDNLIPKLGEAYVPRTFAEEIDVSNGDNIRVGDYVYSATITGDHWLSHQPAVVVNNPDPEHATMVVTKNPPADVPGTTTMDVDDVKTTMASYTAERSSLMAINLAIVVIGGLLSLVFFTMWSSTRAKDISILKALGVPTSRVVADHLGLVISIIVTGVAIGAGASLALGSYASPELPFAFGWGGIAMVVILVVAGIIGSLVSLKAIVSADPHDVMKR